MNDEIKERLIRYLDSVEGKVEKAIDFTSDQVPLYVQELCQYGAVSNLIVVGFCLIALILIVVAFAVANFLARKCDLVDRGGVAAVSFVIAAGVAGFISLAMIDAGREAYKAAYCPRVYVVEQIGKLTK